VTARRGAARRAAVRPPNGVSRVRASILIGGHRLAASPRFLSSSWRQLARACDRC
jgi:hypothetical protein